MSQSPKVEIKEEECQIKKETSDSDVQVPTNDNKRSQHQSAKEPESSKSSPKLRIKLNVPPRVQKLKLVLRKKSEHKSVGEAGPSNPNPNLRIKLNVGPRPTPVLRLRLHDPSVPDTDPWTTTETWKLAKHDPTYKKSIRSNQGNDGSVSSN